jgi:His-Xaa-Ser system protein HxsD
VIELAFDETTHSIDVLNAAAYRLLGAATCQMSKSGSMFICHLTQTNTRLDDVALRARFLDLVTDENVRENIAHKTEPVRNLILSLAFGSLANSSSDKS